MNALTQNPSRLLDLAAITPSKLNPRKDFNAAELERLAANIRINGVLEPILVRELTAAGQPLPGQFEIVCGERRWRAAPKGGLKQIPAIVIVADDAEALRIMLAENEIRDNLRALERSGAHQQMLKRGLTIEQIAKDTSTSAATVRDSLKLQDLTPEVKKAWAIGRLDYSKALEIAKVPESMQGQVLADALEENVDGELMSVRQLRQHIQHYFMLDLKQAPFEIADPQLLPKAGACTTCPKRTGAQVEFFSHIKADLCTDKPCFAAKADAHLVAAEKAGAKVLSGKEAAAIFSAQDDRLLWDSDYVLANSKPEKQTKAASKLVDKSEIVLAKTPGGQVVELVAKDALPKPEKVVAPKAVQSDEEKKLEREYKLRVETAKLARLQLLEKVGETNGNDVAWMRCMVGAMVSSARGGAIAELSKRRGWPKGFDIVKLADAEEAPFLRALLFDIAFAERFAPYKHQVGFPQELTEACELMRVDLKALGKDARAKLDGKVKAPEKAPLGNWIQWKPRANGAQGKLGGRTYEVIGHMWQAKPDLEGGSCDSLEDGKQRCNKAHERWVREHPEKQNGAGLCECGHTKAAHFSVACSECVCEVFEAKTWTGETPQAFAKRLAAEGAKDADVCGALDGKGAGAKPGLECRQPAGHDGAHSNHRRSWPNKKPKAKKGVAA